MYAVWPVLDTDSFSAKLQAEIINGSGTRTCYILATALSAATIAQLRLGSDDVAAQKISAAAMEKECVRMRCKTNYMEKFDVNNVLTSFFLHVYHAKLDNRRAAMMFLQEAISFARILQMDATQSIESRVIYALLWVSERYLPSPLSIIHY